MERQCVVRGQRLSTQDNVGLARPRGPVQETDVQLEGLRPPRGARGCQPGRGTFGGRREKRRELPGRPAWGG